MNKTFENVLSSNVIQSYILIDAARDGELLQELRAKKIPHECLFSGVKAITLADVAPYVVSASALHSELSRFVGRAWGTAWTTIVQSDKGIDDVRMQLKRNLMVELGDDQTAYFRFYDSRAFERFSTICTAEQMRQFLGNVFSYWYWMGATSTELRCIEAVAYKPLFQEQHIASLNVRELVLTPNPSRSDPSTSGDIC